MCAHAPEGGMNHVTGATLSVWTDTHSCSLVPPQGKHHQLPNAITLPAKHSGSAVLVLSRELILFVMRCLSVAAMVPP